MTAKTPDEPAPPVAQSAPPAAMSPSNPLTTASVFNGALAESTGRGETQSTEHAGDNSLVVSTLLEEYRQLYGLAIFRLHALDQRLVLAGTGLLAIMGSIVVLPAHALWVMLVAAPASLPWLLRSTIRHAGSFQDALDRIAAIEQDVNRYVGLTAMTFQSTHPSRGRSTGGRTGSEAIEAIQGAAAIILGGCLYLSTFTAARSDWVVVAYAIAVAAIAGGLIAIARRWRLPITRR